jgi:fibronectin type III domain protein
VKVSVKVKNVGQREGDEVVQVYVHEVSPAVKRPVKQLRGFRREHLGVGEERVVSFLVPASSLAYWDENTHGFVVKPGEFEVMVGASSDDIRGRSSIQVKAD